MRPAHWCSPLNTAGQFAYHEDPMTVPDHEDLMTMNARHALYMSAKSIRMLWFAIAAQTRSCG